MPRIPTRLRGLKTAFVNELQHPGIAVPEDQRVIQPFLHGKVRRVEATFFQHDTLVGIEKYVLHNITLLF